MIPFLAATLLLAIPDEALQRCLAQRAERDHFSGVIAASRAGQPVALLARGRLGGDGSPELTPHARFNLASASKMFTAVAVAQLVDAGKIQLDDPVGRFVKGLTPETAAVTVKQLLTHSAGLGNFFKPDNMEAMLKARTASDLLPLIAADKPAFPPGSRFEYSNTGFALLGVLVERVSGQSYGDYLKARVFAPAGMTDTGLDPNPLATLAVAMTARSPHGPAPLHPAPGATVGFGSPAGGLYGTALDLQRFAQALASGKLVRAETAAALTSPQILAAPAEAGKPERNYGYGFGVGTEQGHKWFGHNGGTLGANSEFVVFPGEQLTLTVLSNRDPPSATEMLGYLRSLALNPSTSCQPGATSE